jgi:hypothetical protein
MHRRCLLLIALITMSSSVFALSEAEISQLVPVEQVELAKMMTDRVGFLPGGHAIVGGWLEWPQTPAVLCLPSTIQAMQVGLQAASPRFAISPDGKRLALWKRVSVGGQDRAELNIVQFESQMVSGCGEPIPITQSMYLAWLPGGQLVYATEDPQRPLGLLYLADLGGGKPRKLLELHEGQWADLRPGPGPAQVYAVWGGTTPTTYSVSCGGDFAPPMAVANGEVSPDESHRSLETDAQGALIIGLSATEGVVVDRGVRAAAWRPDGQALAYVKDRQVFLTSPTGQEPHLLVDISKTSPDLFLRGVRWSPDGVQVAFWGVAGNSGRAWRASLGVERVTARFTFPREAPIKAENRLWIVTKFKYDVMGNIVEPIWNTLKAQFVVTRILRTPEGIIAESTSAGPQGGIVDRLSAGPAQPDQQPERQPGMITIGVGGQTTSMWSRTSTLQFRPGLTAWLEKTKYTGVPESLQVERQMLTPIAQQ